jgi:hypothetical protein
VDPEQIIAQNKEADEVFRRLMEVQHAQFGPNGDAIVLATGDAFAWRIPASIKDSTDRRTDKVNPDVWQQTTQLASIAADVASHCVRIEHDEGLSEVGKANAKQKVLEKQLPEAKRRIDWIYDYMRELEAEEAKFYAADTVGPNDVAAAMLDYEIRQRYFALDEKGQLSFIDQHAKDIRVLSALVRSPLPVGPAVETIKGELNRRLQAHFRAHKDAQDPRRASGLKAWRTIAEFAKTVAEQVAPTIPKAVEWKRRPGGFNAAKPPKQRPTPMKRSQFDKLEPARQFMHATSGGEVVD